MIKKCLLCNSNVKLFYKSKKKDYYKCEDCLSVMLDPSYYLTEEAEKERYETHNNDVKDISYQNFVAPIFESIKENYSKDHVGLDYGAGNGPVVTSLFHHYPEYLSKNYDYIICSEVVEHFHNPYNEFKRLGDILKPGGSIFCLTSLYDEDIDFQNWYYKNDATHVFFYHRKAFEWLAKEFKFSDLKINGKLIKLTK